MVTLQVTLKTLRASMIVMAMVEFNVAMIMTAVYTLFKRRASHLDTHYSGPAKT